MRVPVYENEGRGAGGAADPPETPASDAGVAEAAAGGAIGVFQRSFAVLEYVVRAGRPVTPADIAAALELPKPTVYRMLEGFAAQGLLHRPFASRRVTVGPRLADFAFEILRASVQFAPRRAILDALVREVGETCNIGTLDANEIVYIDRVEATHWPLRLQFGVGSRVPLHCTAIGKMFLAHLPERACEALLEGRDLRGFTPASLTDRAALARELDAVRAAGVALDREEYLAGVVCMAAPVFDTAGDIRAGIAIQAPAARMPPETIARAREPLLRAARLLAASLAAASLAGD